MNRSISILLLSSYLFLLTLPLFPTTVHALETSATRGSTTSTNGAGVAWTDSSNAAADDGNNASVISNYGTSQNIRVTNFGFSLPDDIDIDGIEAGLDAGASVSYSANLQLVYNGSVIGDIKSNTPTTTFGSSTDMWNTSLTQAQANDSSFGIQFSVSGNDETFTVDDVYIKIYYDLLPTVTMTTDGLSNAGGQCGFDHAVTTSPYQMTFTFSEDVTGFDLSDIQVSGTGAATNFATVSSSVYTADISPPTGLTHTVTVPAGVAVPSGDVDNYNVGNTDTVRYDIGWVGCCGVIYLDCTNANGIVRRSGTNSIIITDDETGFPVGELSIDSSTADSTVLANLYVESDSTNKRAVLHTAQGHTGINGATAKLFVPRGTGTTVTYCKGLNDVDTACDSNWANRAEWSYDSGTEQITLDSYAGTVSLSEAQGLTVSRTTAKDSSCVDQDVWSIAGAIASGGQEGGGGGGGGASGGATGGGGAVPEFTHWAFLILILGCGYILHAEFDKEASVLISRFALR